ESLSDARRVMLRAVERVDERGSQHGGLCAPGEGPQMIVPGKAKTQCARKGRAAAYGVQQLDGLGSDRVARAGHPGDADAVHEAGRMGADAPETCCRR